MELRAPHAAAVGHPDRDRERHPPTGSPAVAADVGDQLVETRIRERVVLHLADRSPPGHAETHRGTEDPGLGERRVDAAVGAEAVAQSGRGAEDAARAPDVLPEHDHVGIAVQLDVQRVVDRLDEQELRPSPSILRSSARSSANEGSAVTCACSKRSSGVARRLGLGGGDPGAHHLERLAATLSGEVVVEHAAAAEIALEEADALTAPSPPRRGPGRCRRSGRPRSRAAQRGTSPPRRRSGRRRRVRERRPPLTASWTASTS